MNDLQVQEVKPLALSLCEYYKQSASILGKPVSQLAKLKGMTADAIYGQLIPALIDKDFGERLRYAEIGLQLAQVIDKNRLREEIGIQFIISMDMIIDIIKAGIESTEPWIKRKSMKMYSYLLDENAEKSRFVESLMADQKIKMIGESQTNVNAVMQEIIDFEYTTGNIFEAVKNVSH